jgi:hypothetical protein
VPSRWAAQAALASQIASKEATRGSERDQVGNFTLWLFNIAMENGPFIDGLPIKNDDFPWLC